MIKKGIIPALIIGLVVWTFFGCGKKKSAVEEKKVEPAAEQVTEQAAEQKPAVELPAAVAQVVKEKFPEAQIEKTEVEEKAGLTLYDIEFKEGKGEIELTSEGDIIDISTIITMEELPEGAAKAIQKAAEGATIKQLEKAEVWSEISEEGKLVKLDNPKYVYEAELIKDNVNGEIAVANDGTVVEKLKWENKEENKEAIEK